MSDQPGITPAPDPLAGSARPWWLPGVDTYEWRARLAPAVLVTAPLLAAAPALAVVAGSIGLEGFQRLWALLLLAVVPLAAALTRRLGKAAQPQLWASWGGPPTTDRFRWSSGAHDVIAARHAEVTAVLRDRARLPTAAVEAQDPAAADSIYGEAVRRLLGLTRNDPRFKLLRQENANYGFARNVYGARRLALAVAVTTLLVVVLVGAYVIRTVGLGGAAPCWSLSSSQSLPSSHGPA